MQSSPWGKTLVPARTGGSVDAEGDAGREDAGVVVNMDLDAGKESHDAHPLP